MAGTYSSLQCASPAFWHDFSVIKNTVLMPTRMGTFRFFSSLPQNIANMRVSKIRGRRDEISTYFITILFLATYKRLPFRWETAERRPSCRKGLPGLQQGPPGIATGPPLHDESGPVASQGGPYGRETVAFSGQNQQAKTGRSLRSGKAVRPSRRRDGTKSVSRRMTHDCRKALTAIKMTLKRAKTEFPTDRVL